VLTLGGIFIIIVPSIVGTLIVAPLTASSILIGISISKLLSFILKKEESYKACSIKKRMNTKGTIRPFPLGVIFHFFEPSRVSNVSSIYVS
jgi:uncharacterized membrane protein YkgB